MKHDRIASIVFFLLGALMVREGLQLPYMAETAPGPGMFPVWLGIVLMLLSTVLFFTTRSPNKPFIENMDGFRKSSLVAGSFLVFALLLSYLGVFVGLVAFLGFLGGWIERKAWPRWVAMSLALSVGCYLVFRVWLGVPLPRGILGI